MSQNKRKQGIVVNKHMLLRLLVIVVAMFVFGYALVPLYKAICEATGINVLTKQDKNTADLVKNTQVDTSRTIEIIFDGNERGSWKFKPAQSSMQVHPGEIATIHYDIENTLPHAAQGQAIPSYLPMVAASHFNKLECFCFRQQPFKAGEKKSFPVVFVIDPEIPKDVHTITLSYTFFEVAGATAMATESNQ